MIVTAIAPHVRRPGRFAIDIDGRERAILSLEAIQRLRLATGVPVDDLMSADIDREAATLATYDRALNLLALRARSAVELRQSLLKKGESPANADAALDRLAAAGFLDDADFARQFGRAKAASAGVSRRWLTQELARRGVARDVASAAIDAVFAEESFDEATAVERIARRKSRTLSRLDPATRRRRLYDFLARRGYDNDAIARAMRSVDADRSDADRSTTAD